MPLQLKPCQRGCLDALAQYFARANALKSACDSGAKETWLAKEWCEGPLSMSPMRSVPNSTATPDLTTHHLTI